MGLDLKVYLAIDDNSPKDSPPFTHDPSIWSLQEDYGLTSCGETGFFAALGFQDDESYGPPLFGLRGTPEFVAQFSESRRWLELEDYVGWLSASELFEAIAHRSIEETKLARPIRVLLGTIRLLCSEYGEDRVRMIFAFVP